MNRSGWANAMAHAAMNFGIAPDVFWRLSLCEWRALTAHGVLREAPSRDEFETLLQAFEKKGMR